MTLMVEAVVKKVAMKGVVTEALVVTIPMVVIVRAAVTVVTRVNMAVQEVAGTVETRANMVAKKEVMAKNVAMKAVVDTNALR